MIRKGWEPVAIAAALAVIGLLLVGGLIWVMSFFDHSRDAWVCDVSTTNLPNNYSTSCYWR